MSLSPQALAQRLAELEARLAQSEQQIFRLRRDAFAYRAEALLRKAGRQPRLPVSFNAQFGEDTVLWELLGCPLDGFFIEVGAYDGEKFSVSYGFEAMGWKGLLVEAIPAAYDKCRAARPGSRVVHAALSRPGHPPTATFTVSTSVEMLSYLKADPHHLADFERRKLPTATVEVPVMTMNDALAACQHTGAVDFASIDVEGGEVDLLDGFDLERWRPRLLMIEDSAMQADSAVLRWMQGGGGGGGRAYEHIGNTGVNRLYARRDDADIAARLKRMRDFLE